MNEENTDDKFGLLVSAVQAERSRLKEEIDSQKYLIRSVLSLGSFLVVALGAATVYLVGNSISELKSDVLALADARVQAAISSSKENIASIEEVSSKLSKAEADYDRYRETINSLEGLKALDALGVKDPHGMYSKIRALEEKSEKLGVPLSDEERALVLSLLELAIDASRKGLTEPNTIFNLAVLASRLDFNIEAVQLAVLTEYWQPSISHQVIRAEYSNLYGVEFSFDGTNLKAAEKTAQQVRAEAWAELKQVVSSPPRHEAEQAYSRASNVAVRNRSSGYYSELIEEIKRSLLIGERPITSYGLLTLARLYTWQSDKDWLENYRSATARAIALMATESPRSSWYPHSLSLMLKTAAPVDQIDFVLKEAEKQGISKKALQKAVRQISTDKDQLDDAGN